MKLSQFNFDLPQDRIAQNPPRWRDEARLLVLHKDTGEMEHRLFKDIIDCLCPQRHQGFSRAHVR